MKNNFFKNLTPRTWLVLLLIAAFLIWIYLIIPQPKSDARTFTSVPLPGTPGTTPRGTNTGGGGGSTSTGSLLYFAPSLPYNFTPKEFFVLQKTGNMYSDLEPGDYYENGLRKRNANGRTYTVFYCINEIPLVHSNGAPKDFNNIQLPTGCFISIRKMYAQSDWVQAHTQLFDKGYEAWYLNPAGDENRTFKTIIQDITT